MTGVIIPISDSRRICPHCGIAGCSTSAAVRRRHFLWTRQDRSQRKEQEPRGASGRLTRTRSEAYVLSRHTAVLFVEGVSGCVALDAVHPMHD